MEVLLRCSQEHPQEQVVRGMTDCFAESLSREQKSAVRDTVAAHWLKKTRRGQRARPRRRAPPATATSASLARQAARLTGLMRRRERVPAGSPACGET